MKINKVIFGCALAVGIGYFCLVPTRRAGAADDVLPVPPVIQDGFQVWTKKQNSSYAFDIWKKAGLLDEDKKPSVLSGYFSRIDQTVGNYKSYEVVESKRINESSEIFYLAINFEHAVVYARFLVYRADKAWVVQNMDFSLRPETLMPWLAFAGENYSQ
jgi:hypothetical protein